MIQKAALALPELYSEDETAWLDAMVEQRQELRRLAGRGGLRNHATAVLPEVYREAVERAVVETGLPPDAFPAECVYSLDELLSFDPSPDVAEQDTTADRPRD
jgi:hypothetical protein